MSNESTKDDQRNRMKKNTVEIPVSILEHNLTLSEIGAIVIIMASNKMSWASKKLWDNDRTFTKTTTSLQHQNIISSDFEGCIHINLETEEVLDDTQ